MSDKGFCLSGVLLVWLLTPALLPAQTNWTLENESLRLDLRTNAAVFLSDKRSGASWMLESPAVLQTDQQLVPVRPRGSVTRTNNTLRYGSEWGIEIELRLVENPAAVEYSFHGGFMPFNGPEIQEVQLLRHALPVEPGPDNYYAIPERMGVLVRADGSRPFSRRMDAYRTGRGYSMAMLGAVRSNAAVLVTWEAPETDLLLDNETDPQRRLTMGLALRGMARTVRLEPLGKGGYVEIAKAYRRVAEQRGLVKPLAEKVRENPTLERLFGAAELKSFTLIRRVAHTRFNATEQDQLQINASFEDVGKLATHFKNDIGIDRALVVVAGWNRRGYDNQLPDIFPAAEETGGNAGLVACSHAVKDAGWLFGLHDNYQDMYRDAPSWDEADIVKNPDGTLQKGGEWVGGQTYLICSKQALNLISRPENLPLVSRTFSPDAYFLDCIYANPPRLCFDPKHPTSKADDIRYKQQLADYVRQQRLILGGEEGYEWGVAHSDYFAGMLSHKTRPARAANSSIVIPLFDLVYHDCILLYQNHRDRMQPDQPGYVLDHLLYGTMPGYAFGDYTTWLSTNRSAAVKEIVDPRLVFARGGRLDPAEQFIKNTYEVLSPLNRLTALLPMTDHRFVTPDREVEATRFGSDVNIIVNYGASDYTTTNAVLPQYGFLVESPTLIAFHACSYRGRKFTEPTLFVVRSLDGRPLASATKARLYRAFGDRSIEWNDRTINVETEQFISGKE